MTKVFCSPFGFVGLPILAMLEVYTTAAFLSHKKDTCCITFALNLPTSCNTISLTAQGEGNERPGERETDCGDRGWIQRAASRTWREGRAGWRGPWAGFRTWANLPKHARSRCFQASGRSRSRLDSTSGISDVPGRTCRVAWFAERPVRRSPSFSKGEAGSDATTMSRSRPNA